MNHTPYIPPRFLKNGHVQTIFPSLFRKVKDVHYTRERIHTPDKDFLDLDWSRQGNEKLAIISHGLEGSTDRAYVKGMVRALNQNNWDALAWNYRSCSGVPNATLRSYHNGSTDDLAVVIQHAANQYHYQQIVLIGFSLGGNLTLLHLGRDQVDSRVKAAIAFSVPCDLAQSARVLARPSNKIYMKRFLVLLKKKIQDKKRLFPGQISDENYHRIKDFKGFDDAYTAPIHGFKDAHDYWEKCSSKPYIGSIKVPTLIVNAKNDPFLAKACFPFKEADENPQVTFEATESGGHVGFIRFNKRKRYWSEARAIAFLEQNF